MWLSLQAAHQRLADLTHHTAVPAYLDHVNRYTFSATSHVLIGDMAVPGYKYRQQWRFLDRDIQKSGKRLAGLEIDPGDLVDAGLEASEPHTWRSRVWQWISQATYESELPRMQGPGVLSKNFTGQQLPEAFTQRTIASTRPLPLMVWSGKEWLVPRAYAAVLDRAEEVEAGLAAQDDVCSGCGTPAGSKQWRSSSASGFVVLCPSCAAQAARPYTGHLRGRQYTKAFAKRSPAEAFLCRMCPEPRRALYWDHCHSHGLFRGPLCVKCNNSEGTRGFIDRPGAVDHLLQCTDCRAQRTLPLQHHADIVRCLAVFEPHAACTHELSWRWFYVEDDGSVLARFQCYQHQPELVWSVTVPSDEVKLLVRQFIDEVIGPGL
ncbi:endonuclease VII domain-containing protein [Streptomyces huasconensis]|uniref:endonuclease domain-containing protein n=2 Tax=Streptomyces TaxID=1883 RepID=UPI001E57BC39|nr:endonuclease domain-containing protein [Streptomyces huasconensis]UFQ13559.1 endonuclease VII domain-containing protein [Streptomyces huasconensis]UFQ19975.1 endonuclease VII domain-containing protein [Streptomyces huasconensis]